MDPSKAQLLAIVGGRNPSGARDAWKDPLRPRIPAMTPVHRGWDAPRVHRSPGQFRMLRIGSAGDGSKPIKSSTRLPKVPSATISALAALIALTRFGLAFLTAHPS